MDNDDFLWPLSSSPLFVPALSPSPTPSAFAYQAMRRRQTDSPARQRAGKLPASVDRTRSKLATIQQPQQEQAHGISDASGSGSGSGPASGSGLSGDAASSSSNLSTPQSSFSSAGSEDSSFSTRARDKRPAATGFLSTTGRVRMTPRTRTRPRQESENTEERASKRQRIIVEPYDAFVLQDEEDDSEDSLFVAGDSGNASFLSVDDLFEDLDMRARQRTGPAPVIDLTDDLPSGDGAANRLRQSSRQASIHASRPASTLGSRTAPILIDDLDSPAAPRARSIRPVGGTPAQPLQQQSREPSVEILDTIVARQQEEAVAAQSTSHEDAFTVFGNMMCVICMDKPRNLSMVPCGHVFCGACITEALRHSESRIHEHTGQRKAACPVCRETVVRSRKEHIVPILLKKGRRREAVEPLVV